MKFVTPCLQEARFTANIDALSLCRLASMSHISCLPSPISEPGAIISHIASNAPDVDACDVDSSAGSGATSRGWMHRLLFESSALFALCSCLIFCRHDHNRVNDIRHFSVYNTQTLLGNPLNRKF